MNALPGSHDALSLAVGWTMLHVLWVGATIGAAAAIAGRATRSARPEIRYVIALVFLAALGLAPMVIFAWAYEPPVAVNTAVAVENVPIETTSLVTHDSIMKTADSHVMLAPEGRNRVPVQSRLEPVVAFLPWVWLAGSCLTLVSLALGVIGVERLRRSSRLVAGGEIESRCRALAGSLRIARRVSVGVCDRLAGPILIGLVRPLILLPSAALTGWTPAELEMVLLHELAHVRRWDNLVNIIQRVIEALLFFHPAAWRLSAWVRLERELACDRLVVGRLGEPFAYAEMLLLMATSRRPGPGVASALADRLAATRIRRLLNPGDRSMKLTMPEGLGLAGAVVVAALMAVGLRASDPPVDGKDREIGQALAQAAADLAALPHDPADRMSKPMAMIDVASAQLAVGDRAGALGTLKKLGESAALADGDAGVVLPGTVLIRVAQNQRKAGDHAAARATLDRVQKQIRFVTDKAIVSAMNNLLEPDGVKGVQPPDPEGGASLRATMFRCELLFLIAEEWLALGDRAQAIAIARDALKMADANPTTRNETTPNRLNPGVVTASIKAEMRSWKVMTRGAVGVIQHKAGNPEWRATLTEARRLAATLTTVEERADVLPYLARFLTETDEVDQAIEVMTTLDRAARPPAFRMMIDALVDDHPTGAWLDQASIKITIGAESFALKNRDMARRALPKIAQAVRAGVEPLHQARLLSMIAHLQAKADDFVAARATCLSMPSIKRTDYPGPADGFYDAVKPVTLGLVAETRAKSDPGAASQAEAKALLSQAVALSRAVPTPEQKVVALIAIAQAASGLERGLANSLIGEASTVALGLKEPVRSRALTMLVGLQADAGELAVATLTAQAIRDYPGLEKHRALARIADDWAKRGDHAVAIDLRRKGLAFLENGPPADAKAQMGAVRPMRVFSAHSYVDFEMEFEPAINENARKTAAAFARAKLVDQADGMRVAQGLAGGMRDIITANLVGQMARDGKPIEALKLAKSLETPAQRLTAIELVAIAIREGRSAK